MKDKKGIKIVSGGNELYLGSSLVIVGLDFECQAPTATLIDAIRSYFQNIDKNKLTHSCFIGSERTKPG